MPLMRFLVLGPLEVIGERGDLPISGSKERTILAFLISRVGWVVSVDEFIEELWGERPPRTAEKTLGSYISRLRRSLDPDRVPGSGKDLILSRSDGYSLEIADHEIDVARFERLVEVGRRLLDEGRPGDARAPLDEALGLWRGQAYQGYRYTGFGIAEGERLEELRRSATEDRIDSRLAAGDAGELVAELETMVRDEPLRERRWGQLMLALYRAGRQAEALQTFTRARTVLIDDLGIEPGPDLQRLQVAILDQDASLEHDRGGDQPPVPPTDVCPYKGLARYEISDAEFFFGRERVVADAVGRLVAGRFLAFVGASGSGKSSLIRAGLVHALAAGAVPGSDRWTYAVMRPGDDPLTSLSAALGSLAPRDPPDGDQALDASLTPNRSVLVVDQFEESFTACTDGDERTAFLDSITALALLPDGAVTVVLAMRADYYGRCADHDALASLLATSQILVRPLKADELRRAIELPAERAGLTVEDGLSDVLVEHTASQPGGLPLLSTALLELWTKRRDRTLRLDDYLQSGGIEGAVARLAEDAFGRLDGKGQAAAKRILLRLAGPGEGREVVSRAVSLSEFELERDADASRALAALTDARLVTVTEGTAEVAHEALLRDWPRFRAWLEDDAEGRRLHRHVTESAHAWEEGGRDEGDLYRGARLTSALEWADAHQTDLNGLEWLFLRRSGMASEGEAVRARRAHRRAQALLAGVASLLAISLAVGSMALRQRDASRAKADVADSRQLAATSLTEKDLVVSLLLAREAVDLDNSAQARNSLLTALQREPTAIAVMHANGSPPGDLTEWLRLSPDGQTLATGGARTTVDLFDAASYQPLGAVSVGAQTSAGAFNPDDGTLAVATIDRRIVRVDVKDETVRASTPPTRRDIDSVLFTPQGDLFTAESIEGQGFLVRRDPATLQPIGTPVSVENGPVTAMASSANGHRLVTTIVPIDDDVRAETALWNAQTLERTRTFPGVSGNDVALSPDGRHAAIAASISPNNTADELEGRLEFLDLQTGSIRKSPEGRVNGRSGGIGLTGVAYAADGRSVVSTGDDNRVLIWDASSATIEIEQVLENPAALVLRAPVLSPDGATVLAVDVDGNVVAWDRGGTRSMERSFTAGSGQTNGGPSFAISPDGSTLAVIQASESLTHGSIQLVDTSTLEVIGVIRYNRYVDGSPRGVAFSPDSRTLAVTSVDGYVGLWDAHTGSPEGPPLRAARTHPIEFWAAAFSPDGSVLATAGAAWESQRPGRVLLWDTSTGRLIERLPEQGDPVSAVNYSPDGSLLVVSTGWADRGGGDVLVWNVDERRSERTIHADDSGVTGADLSNDGTTLATGGLSHRARLWDLSSGGSIGPPFNAAGAITVDLSPDGRTLVSAGDGGVSMWDVATGTVLGSFQDVGTEGRLAPAFTPDGRRLFIVSGTGDAWVWDVRPDSWAERACQIAGRSMTQAEWRLYLPERSYETTCGPNGSSAAQP